MYFQKKTFTLNTFAFTSINLHADDDVVSFTNPLLKWGGEPVYKGSARNVSYKEFMTLCQISSVHKNIEEPLGKTNAHEGVNRCLPACPCCWWPAQRCHRWRGGCRSRPRHSWGSSARWRWRRWRPLPLPGADGSVTVLFNWCVNYFASRSHLLCSFWLF